MATDLPIDVLEYRDGVFRAARVGAIREVPLRIVVNGREPARLMFTGAQSAEGHLKRDGDSITETGAAAFKRWRGI